MVDRCPRNCWKLPESAVISMVSPESPGESEPERPWQGEPAVARPQRGAGSGRPPRWPFGRARLLPSRGRPASAVGSCSGPRLARPLVGFSRPVFATNFSWWPRSQPLLLTQSPPGSSRARRRLGKKERKAVPAIHELKFVATADRLKPVPSQEAPEGFPRNSPEIKASAPWGMASAGLISKVSPQFHQASLAGSSIKVPGIPL